MGYRGRASRREPSLLRSDHHWANASYPGPAPTTKLQTANPIAARAREPESQRARVRELES